MRLQLSAAATAAVAGALCAAAAVAEADDRTELSTALFAEKRDGGKGGLTVVHPQLLFGIDVGRFVSLDVGYVADIVSGATATVYQVDATTGATKFSDVRNEGTLTLGFHGKRSRLSFTGTFGTERDYLTRQVGGSASIDLPGRNTTVGLAYSHGSDLVCNRDNGLSTPLETRALTGADKCTKNKVFAGADTLDATGARLTTWEGLSIDTAQVSLTQNLSPTMNLQLALFGQVLEGFQSNPYRRVQVGPNTPQEHIPDTRARWSLTARLNRYLPKLSAAAHFEGRFYNDTWGVTGGNVGIGYSQYIGKPLVLRFQFRLYQQSAATFFRDAFFYETLSSAGEYWTGDRELSPVRNATLGGKLTLITVGEERPVWGLFDKLQLHVKGDVMLIDVVAADSPVMNVEGIDRQFIYGNSLIDGVVLQLGLMGSY
ncbi:MAG TPA: DUF3570 domain-containing protein [Kofleriaceae bacterium]|nr:DUF3570 domain-containing protein [Kofleriaceae bacterium]